LVDGGDVDGGLVVDGKFVESCCHGPVFLQLTDAALDRVTLLVPLGIECRWAPTGRALLAPVGGLVLLDRDRRGDPEPEQALARRRAAVVEIARRLTD
jgi:hypothetical protein